MEASSSKRVVILGKTGSGKSHLANTIFGEDVFGIDHTFNSGTTECQHITRSVNGKSITLIDSPGFFDTHLSDEMRLKIVQCIVECAPGPHAFLIVLKVEKFTEQEKDVIDKIKEYFSEEVYKYATIVFTHGDQLPEGQKIEELVKQNKPLKELVEKCGGRCHVIDNKYWNNRPSKEYRSNQHQVGKLLNTIDEMIDKNQGRYYTNEVLEKVEEKIQQEEEEMRVEETIQQSEEEIRKKAKLGVFKEISVQVARTTAAVLLGALLGVVKYLKVMKKVMEEIAPGRGSATTAAALAGAVTLGVLEGAAASDGAYTRSQAIKRAAKVVKKGADGDEDKPSRPKRKK